MSESVTSSLSTRQPTTRVLFQPLKVEPRKEGKGAGQEGAGPSQLDTRPQLDTQPSLDSMGEIESRYASFGDDSEMHQSLPMDHEGGVTLQRVQNVPDGDFARNVRRTSTPIDSLTPDSSRTYEYEGGAVGGAEGVPIASDESRGGGGGFCGAS